MAFGCTPRLTASKTHNQDSFGSFEVATLPDGQRHLTSFSLEGWKKLGFTLERDFGHVESAQRLGGQIIVRITHRVMSRVIVHR